MPEISSHNDGMFSYSDLTTTDIAAARIFYTDLFGWNVNEQPLPEGDVYLMFEKKGKVAAAASQQPGEQRAQGVPPMWNTYFTVSDLDLRTKEAEAAGGTIYADPFDVMEAGRMSVIADPTGAVFCLWEPKAAIGAEIMYEPNTLVWTECSTTDVDKARTFYSSVMGWTFEEADMGDAGTYTLFQAEDQYLGGMMPSPMDMSYWMVYFAVGDCEQMTEKVRSMGGTIHLDAETVPSVGTLSIVSDPQGAMFGLLEPDPT